MLNIPQARALLTRTRPEPNRVGYPASVRGEIVALTQHLLSQGRTVTSVARELGLAGSTVRSWLEAGAVASSAFVPVVVVETVPENQPGPAACPDPSLVPSTPRPGGLTLVSPRGFRLEGLDLDSALVALQRLS